MSIALSIQLLKNFECFLIKIQYYRNIILQVFITIYFIVIKFNLIITQCIKCFQIKQQACVFLNLLSHSGTRCRQMTSTSYCPGLMGKFSYRDGTAHHWVFPAFRDCQDTKLKSDTLSKFLLSFSFILKFILKELGKK